MNDEDDEDDEDDDEVDEENEDDEVGRPAEERLQKMMRISLMMRIMWRMKRRGW